MRRQKELFDRVASFANLYQAAYRALRGKKDQIQVAAFYFHLENEIIQLQKELLSEIYEPREYVIFEIQEPKVRKICSSNFRDRVVHHAICSILEPHFESRLIFDTYACRIGKGSHAAIKRCQSFVKANRYYLKCDIKKFFESVDHQILKGLIYGLIKDPRLLYLLEKIIDHPVLGNVSGKGIPIGNLTSQHFANLYLAELDHFLKERLRVKSYLRYMDDFIVFGANKSFLDSILVQTREFLINKLKLELKEKVIHIAPVTEGIPFLGMRIFGSLIRIQRSNLIRFRKKIKKLEFDYVAGKIGENDLVCSIQSIVAHWSHANTLSLRRKEFSGSMGLA